MGAASQVSPRTSSYLGSNLKHDKQVPSLIRIREDAPVEEYQYELRPGKTRTPRWERVGTDT